MCESQSFLTISACVILKLYTHLEYAQLDVRIPLIIFLCDVFIFTEINKFWSQIEKITNFLFFVINLACLFGLHQIEFCDGKVGKIGIFQERKKSGKTTNLTKKIGNVFCVWKILYFYYMKKSEDTKWFYKVNIFDFFLKLSQQSSIFFTALFIVARLTIVHIVNRVQKYGATDCSNEIEIMPLLFWLKLMIMFVMKR